MYLKYAEIGESETSLDILDYFVRNYMGGTQFEKHFFIGMMDTIGTFYKYKDKEALELHATEQPYNMMVRIAIYDERLKEKYMKEVPKFIELSKEYLRIIEGTSKQGRKKHLKVV